MSVSVLNTTAGVSGKTLALLEGSQTFTGQKTFDVGASAPFVVVSGAAKVTNLDADKLDGETGADYHNATNLSSGTVPDARFPSTLPALNGSALTNLNATNLATGAVAIDRMVGADPGADRIIFWDESENALKFLTVGSGLDLTTTTLTATQTADLSKMQGRLTLTTAVPVTSSDVTAATTLRYALYNGKYVTLYSGTAWSEIAIAELSIAVPATTNQMYDVFVDYNSGVPALVLTGWTNDTTRATALTLQDGVLVLTGSSGRSRFIGCMRTTGVSGQTEDSLARRLVWNYHHQKKRPFRKVDATDSWNYTTTTWRQANGSAANQVDCIVGVQESSISMSLLAHMEQDYNPTDKPFVGIGHSSTTAPTRMGRLSYNNTAAAESLFTPITVSGELVPTLGYQYFAWLEKGGTGSTFYGDGGAATDMQSGLDGFVMG